MGSSWFPSPKRSNRDNSENRTASRQAVVCLIDTRWPVFHPLPSRRSHEKQRSPPNSLPSWNTSFWRAVSPQLSFQRSAPLTRLRRNELNQKLSRVPAPTNSGLLIGVDRGGQAMVDFCLVPLCPSFSMTSAAAMY